MAPERPGTIGLVVTEANTLACMTTTTDEGLLVMVAQSEDIAMTIRLAAGPLAACDPATIAPLKVIHSDR